MQQILKIKKKNFEKKMLKIWKFLFIKEESKWNAQ